MRAVRAKELRKYAYGNKSIREPRSYIVGRTSGMIVNKPGTLRSIYQNLKKKI